LFTADLGHEIQEPRASIATETISEYSPMHICLLRPSGRLGYLKIKKSMESYGLNMASDDLFHALSRATSTILRRLAVVAVYSGWCYIDKRAHRARMQIPEPSKNWCGRQHTQGRREQIGASTRNTAKADLQLIWLDLNIQFRPCRGHELYSAIHTSRSTAVPHQRSFPCSLTL